MFISRLELNGFKSFASKTTLDFRPGVMAVVGPNGCGKTNIVDAVRWVLGEQRTGALRAERMESVIFNGTAKRKPIGMSEVTLTVENDRGILPSVFTQVEITRRLFRSGESEYLINRTPSRLRDIQELFIDTGFGHATYSIIELSMVEGIISGPSESRRALFEEAAGVAKFKSRRTAAERRLESTREALERLKDVYSEVEKSYQALKRQSGRARRYQSLSRALQLRLLADLSRERLEIISRRLPIEQRLTDLEKTLSDSEADAARLSTELLTLEAAEINIDGRIGRLQESLKRVERREAELDGELALVRQRSRQLAAESETAFRRSTELHAAIEIFSRSEVETKIEADQLATRLKNLEQARNHFASESAAAIGNLSTLRKEVEELQIREADLKRRLGSETAISKRTAEERQRIETALNSAILRCDELTARIAALKVTKTGLEAALSESEAMVTRSHAGRAAALELLEKARVDQADVYREYNALRTECETARRILTAHQAQGTTLTGLPKSIRANSAGNDLLTVASRIHCREEHRTAIAAALKPVLEAIDTDSISSAIEISGKLDTGESVTLRTLTAGTFDQPRKIAPPGLIPLSASIEGDGQLEQFLRSRLSDAYLVADRSKLADLTEWASTENIRLVTLSGELLEPDGVLYAGTIDPESYRVGWQKRLKELQTILNGLEKKTSTSGQKANIADQSLAECERDFLNARKSLEQAEDHYAVVRRELNGAITGLQLTEQQLQDTTDELNRLGDALSVLPTVDDSDSASLKVLAEEYNAEAAKKKLAIHKLEELESAERSLSRAITDNAADIARISERHAQAVTKISDTIQSSQTSTKQLAEIEAKTATIAEEQSRALQAAQNIESQLTLVLREKGDLTKSLDAARQEKSDRSTRKQAVNQGLKSSQEIFRRTTEERNQLELEAVAGRERLREIDRRLLEDAGIQPETIIPETPARAEEELRTLELIDVSLEQLKVRIQSLGPVNMLALDELEQVEERYRFLTDQRKDLEGGVELLTETIDRINHEARRRFRETFELVDGNFQRLFRTLFEGGEARITLEGGDPLESDIRIWATPSGKKLQGLAMLSGGEKALTALSLLFAIYMVRPSPFCILDEVDAPLDDANIARYNRLIREFSVNTQFMIVTHNKRSMEAADNLFGVTLAEDGTSQLVSVRLEKNGSQN